MKAMGIVRSMDDLGRITVPKEVRRTLKICPGDPLEIFVDDETLVLRKYDTVGDMLQLLNNVERKIKATDPLISPKKMTMLLSKLSEMKTIVREVEKK